MMQDASPDRKQSGELRQSLARVLCRFDFPIEFTPEQRKEMWVAGRRDYMLKAGRMLKMLERDGMKLSKIS